jgi:hypothetical protein
VVLVPKRAVPAHQLDWSDYCASAKQNLPSKLPGNKGLFHPHTCYANPQNAGLKPAPNPTTFDRMKLSVTVDRDEDGMWVVEDSSIPASNESVMPARF